MRDEQSSKGLGEIMARAIACVLRDHADSSYRLIPPVAEDRLRLQIIAHLAVSAPHLFQFDEEMGCAPIHTEFPLRLFDAPRTKGMDICVFSKARQTLTTRDERRHGPAYWPTLHVELKRDLGAIKKGWEWTDFKRLKITRNGAESNGVESYGFLVATGRTSEMRTRSHFEGLLKNLNAHEPGWEDWLSIFVDSSSERPMVAGPFSWVQAPVVCDMRSTPEDGFL